ncbi:hypothetical protein E1265_14790 [Streptomyces sp. 8K308]|nr:hypothetical protein E1265_14790 [Streptomyces sp. 8K308]
MPLGRRTAHCGHREEHPCCPAHNLRAYADEVFGRLRSADWLHGLPRQELVHHIAELYGDINALHPFREGNGRAQRAFLTQLSVQAGWPLNWSACPPPRTTRPRSKASSATTSPWSG